MFRMRTRFEKPGQKEIEFNVDLEGLPREAAEHIVAMFEDLVKSGREITAGQHVQVGWSFVRVVDAGDGTLTLLEPDGSTLPMQFQDGITETVRQMLLQLWHADSYDFPRDKLNLPTVQHSAVACNRYPAAEGLILSRATPRDPMDSGWFVGCGFRSHDHNDPGELSRVSLYEIFTWQPKIAAWMGFPISSMILLSPGEHPHVFVAEQECVLVEGSYLDRAMHQEAHQHHG